MRVKAVRPYTIMLILTVISVVLLYMLLSGVSSSANPEGSTPGVKGYCEITSSGLECRLLIDNSLITHPLYLKGFTLASGSVNVSVTLGAEGMLLPPYSHVVLTINLSNSTVVVRSISMNGRISYTAEADSPVEPLVEELSGIECTIVKETVVNLTITPGRGVIIPIDYTVNSTGTRNAIRVMFEGDTAGVYLDVKMFAWNDDLVYEVAQPFPSRGCLTLPVLGSSTDYVVKRVTLNIANEGAEPVEALVTVSVMEAPTLQVSLDFMGATVSLKVPVTPHGCPANMARVSG